MTGSFDRPVGAESDVKELEYISFLHQTTAGDVRTDCSIKGEDVQIYLKSRYGIEVDIEVVQERIMQSLGGGNDIDLMELSAILLIPILLKSAALDYNERTVTSSSNHFNTSNQVVTNSKIFGTTDTPDSYTNQRTTVQPITNSSPATKDDGYLTRVREYFFPTANIYNDDQVNDAALAEMIAEAENEVNDGEKAPTLEKGVLLPPPKLFEYASRLILHDLTGDAESSEPLTVEFLVDVLNNYGEYEIAANETLVQEMITVATNAARESAYGNNNDDVILFNGATFAAATTHDVQKYDVAAETKMTTLYDDVYPSQQTLRRQKKHQPDNTGNDVNNTVNEYGKQIFTAPQIDVTAGTFRSKTLMILLWATAIISFCIFYIRRADNQFEEEPQDSLLTVKGDYCNRTYPYNRTFAAYSEPWVANSAAVGCNIGMRVRDWLVLFLMVGAFGSAFTAVGSIGNTIYVSSWWHPLVGCIPVLILSALSLFNPPSLTYLRVLSWAALFLGFYVVVLHIAHVISIVVGDEHLQKHPGIRERLGDAWVEKLRKRFRPRLIEAELLGKKAMAYKLNLLIRNSIRLFKTAESKESIIDTYYGRAIHAYSKDGIYTTDKNVGGLFWTWRAMYDKTLYSVEGVRFSVRVMASNIGQCVVCLFVIWAGYQLLFQVNKNYGDPESIKAYANQIVNEQISANLYGNNLVANVSVLTGDYVTQLQAGGTAGIDCSQFDPQDTYELCRTDADTGVRECQNTNQIAAYCGLTTTQNLTIDEQISLLNQSGYDINGLNDLASSQVEMTIDQLVDSYYPAQQYMVQWPVIVGVVIAFLTALSLTINSLSSTAATILQLRCGKIESLHSIDASRYRAAADTVALLTGSIFWGCLVSSAVTGAVWGFIVFLFVWQVTVFWAQKVFATIIGLLAITLLRLVLLLLYRASFFGGFYRRNPLVCNVGVLMLEWANFTLSAGVIIVRMVKLLVVAGFSIGRIYRPFLAPGIGQLGPIELDGYFTIYLREIMAHEAHRHPYIELLGYVYLMKLKHSNEFATTAGSIWRLLFVHALFPWLQRYRLEAKRPTSYTSDLSVAQIRRLRYKGPQIIVEQQRDGNVETTATRRNSSSAGAATTITPTPTPTASVTSNTYSENVERALNELPPADRASGRDDGIVSF